MRQFNGIWQQLGLQRLRLRCGIARTFHRRQGLYNHATPKQTRLLSLGATLDFTRPIAHVFDKNLCNRQHQSAFVTLATTFKMTKRDDPLNGLRCLIESATRTTRDRNGRVQGGNSRLPLPAEEQSALTRPTPLRCCFTLPDVNGMRDSLLKRYPSGIDRFVAFRRPSADPARVELTLLDHCQATPHRLSELHALPQQSCRGLLGGCALHSFCPDCIPHSSQIERRFRTQPQVKPRLSACNRTSSQPRSPRGIVDGSSRYQRLEWMSPKVVSIIRSLRSLHWFKR